MFAFAKFEIITGTVRALCLSCGKEGIVKSCLIIRVCINVEILLNFYVFWAMNVTMRAPGNGCKPEKPPLSTYWVLVVAGTCIKPFYRLFLGKLFVGCCWQSS